VTPGPKENKVRPCRVRTIDHSLRAQIRLVRHRRPRTHARESGGIAITSRTPLAITFDRCTGLRERAIITSGKGRRRRGSDVGATVPGGRSSFLGSVCGFAWRGRYGGANKIPPAKWSASWLDRERLTTSRSPSPPPPPSSTIYYHNNNIISNGQHEHTGEMNQMITTHEAAMTYWGAR
jgi:hypothetical protein